MPYLIPLIIYLAVALTWARIFRRVGWARKIGVSYDNWFSERSVFQESDYQRAMKLPNNSLA